MVVFRLFFFSLLCYNLQIVVSGCDYSSHRSNPFPAQPASHVPLTLIVHEIITRLFTYGLEKKIKNLGPDSGGGGLKWSRAPKLKRESNYGHNLSAAAAATATAVAAVRREQ